MPNWFPTGRLESDGWRLEVVSLLAVLGDASVSCQAQAISASRLSLLPRLIPAPQALLRATRPARLPSPPANVYGVHSGTSVSELNFFPDLLHPIGDLKPYQLAVYSISWATPNKYDKSRSTKLENLIMPGGFRPRRFRSSPGHLELQSDNKIEITTHLWSPLNVITVLSFLMTVGVFIWALLIKDATAAIAIVCMSLVSTIHGLAFYWKPFLAFRPSNAVVPKGDIVIRTREAAFVIVKCSEEIARELYTGTEKCEYHLSDQASRTLVGIGTFLIMVSVVLLGNCEWTMQAVVTVTYILLNGMYWGCSLRSQRSMWDLSRYHKIDEKFEVYMGPEDPSFTRTLWDAIYVTKSTNWVTKSNAAPNTETWKKWLDLAQKNCHDRYWDAVGEKDRLMAEARGEQYTSAQQKHQRMGAQDNV
ncbi:hypothetical protein FQN57_005897 [Myotisia sp. PD_48]|nr:hypothetical protein FQN57_005897 [Myotisia sp. PD_48]